MSFRFEITLGVLLILIVAGVFANGWLIKRNLTIKNEYEKIRKKNSQTVIKEQHIPFKMTEKETLYLLKGLFGDTLSDVEITGIKIDRRENPEYCTATIKSNSFKYFKYMEAIRKCNDYFVCRFEDFCFGIGCKSPFTLSLRLYPKKEISHAR